MDENLELIASLLKQRTIAANYQVGRLLTTMQTNAGTTHGTNFIGHVSKELKRLRTGGASSTNHLLKCRKLSEEWTETFVDDIQVRGVSTESFIVEK